MRDEKSDALKKTKDVRKIGKKLPWNDADKWVKRYQDENPNPSGKKVYGWLYGCDLLEEMMKYKGCEGIWFFKGIKEVDGKERECLVLYPADKDGKIMGKPIKSLGAKSSDGDNGVQPGDAGQDCPPDCP